MDVTFLNHSKVAMPKAYLGAWITLVLKELKRRKANNLSALKGDLTVVFVDSAKAKQLNKQFRGKAYATDVLSFEGDHGELGELVLCPQVLLKQSKEHKLSFRDECAYMVLHGILHLLGYDHENSKSEADKMFSLQDALFESIDKIS